MRTRELAAEMRAASEEMSTADVNELEALGIARREIEIFEMAGLSRIVRMTDAELYEPDETGGWAFITPVLTQHPNSPESQQPEIYARFGNIVDLASLRSVGNPIKLTAFHYDGILTSNLLVEGQWSKKDFSISGSMIPRAVAGRPQRGASSKRSGRSRSLRSWKRPSQW